MTNDSAHSYTYDAEGNILTVDAGQTATYVYDALDHRVYSSTASGANEYVYDYAGRQISTWNTATNTAIEGRIYWDNRQFAFRAQDGHTYFDHQNWLGTERVRTDALGNTVLTRYSLPWGDGTTQVFGGTDGAQDTADFAGLDLDTESNTEHAQFRNYSPTQGRWLIPDPYAGSYNLNNPQSMNRYAYALNNPISFIDPSGLDCQYYDGHAKDGSWADDTGESDDGCGNSGGGQYAAGCPDGQIPDQYGNCYTTSTSQTQQTQINNPNQEYVSNDTNTPLLPGVVAVAPNSNSYMYIQGIGMVGPSPKPGCDQIARATQAAIHAAATSVQNTKGNVAKLMASLKAAAPTIGVYAEAGTSFLGFSEAVAATAGAYLSGGAEAVGSLAAVYAVGTGVLDFYDQMTGLANSCPVVP